MSPNPSGFIDHLRAVGYHPRSDKHSNQLGRDIANDLVRQCPLIAERCACGELVASLNFTLRVGQADWNVDLVFGVPAEQNPPEDGESVRWSAPAKVQIALEFKAVMTEHRKAVKNRKRDLEAHHEHVHNYDELAIAGGVLVVNASPTFRSPLRQKETVHRKPDELVRHCISELRSVATRGGKTGYGLEAACALVVDADNQDNSAARYAATEGVPMSGDPLHYDTFLRTICDQYRRRFT